MFVPMGTDIEDLHDRISAIHVSARSARELHDAFGDDTLASWTDAFSPWVAAMGARLVLGSHVLARLPSLANAVVSNVPGPPVTLYFGGARLVAVHPFGPIIDGTGLNITVVSARDSIGFGLVTCPALVPDPWEIVASIEREHAVLTGTGAR
jgi:diacylglycerol O-acyltransferase